MGAGIAQVCATSGLRVTLIDVADKRGGKGANFIVGWGSEDPVNEPIVETVMIGGRGTQGFSFTSPARVIKTHAP